MKADYIAPLPFSLAHIQEMNMVMDILKMAIISRKTVKQNNSQLQIKLDCERNWFLTTLNGSRKTWVICKPLAAKVKIVCERMCRLFKTRAVFN